MKRFLLLLTICISMNFISCSEKNDDNQITPPEQIEEPEPEVHEFDVTIYTKSGGIIDSNKPDSFDTQISSNGRSENEFVATIESGIIIAKHVGETKVYVDEDTYNVTVLSPMNTFIPPIAEFGKTKEYIAEKETRQRSQAAHKGLIYNGEQDYIKQVVYMFGEDDGGLKEIQIRMKNSSKYAQCATYLGHLYEQIQSEQINGLYNLVYINAYDIKDATFKVYLPNTYPTGEATTITYLPIEK